MKRRTHLAWAMVAALTHLIAPVAAYAHARTPSLPKDLCSTVSFTVVTPVAPATNRTPLPASHEHHCAHAPCCAGGALGAAAPPPAPVTWLHVALAGFSIPAANTVAAPTPPIVAAQPRGPPALA